MSDISEKRKKELHHLLEGDFQHLVDVIEQKTIVHEPISFAADDEKVIQNTAERLQHNSRELGAETLVEFFDQLKNRAENEEIQKDDELLANINTEIENIQKLLS